MKYNRHWHCELTRFDRRTKGNRNKNKTKQYDTYILIKITTKANERPVKLRREMIL